MEALTKTFNQFRGLFTSMSPSQRGTLAVIPLMIVVAFGFLMVSGRSSSYVPLSWGKVFTSVELSNAEQALSDAGFTGFRREGMRLMVPRKEVDRYNTALLDGGSLPADWPSELEKQQESLGFFGGERKLRIAKDISIGKALRRMIRGFPDINDADVIFDRSKSRGWRSKGSTVTATVSVVTRRGAELSTTRVSAIRSAVSNAISGLDANNVVILDQRNQKAYKAESADDPLNNLYLRRIDEFTQRYQSKIEKALDYIPNVNITVSVDVDNVKRSMTREQTLNAKQTVAIQTNEQKTNRESNQAPARSEAGLVSNKARSLRMVGGINKTQKSSETNSQTTSVPSWKIEEQEIIGAIPKAVQVSVGVPVEYFKKVAEQQAAETPAEPTDGGDPPPAPDIAAIKTKVEADVRATVLKAIGGGATAESVHFNSFVRVERETPELKIPITETIGTVVSQWGGAAGLTLFALWALWMLNKSMPKLPDATELPESVLAVHAPDEVEQDQVEPAEATQRDELQTIVRDNPEMAASVLGKWLQPPGQP